MNSTSIAGVLLMLATVPLALADDANRISLATATKGGGCQLLEADEVDVGKARCYRGISLLPASDGV